MVRLCQDNSLLIIVDVQEKLFPHISNHERLERHLVALIQGIQALQIPILCNQQYTKGLGETIPSVKALLSSVPVHEKLTFSCCGNESFMEALIALNRKNIILVGDLNSTVYSPNFKLVQSDKMKDARSGFGLNNSWNAFIPIFRTNIDQCWVSKKIKVTNFYRGDDIKSDHFPIVAELKIE